MAVEDNKPRCMACSVDLSTRLLDGYSDKDLCANCKKRILDTFKRSYTMASDEMRHQWQIWLGLKNT